MNAVADIASEYVTRYGVAVVQIPPGSKAPQHTNWNQPGGYFTDGAQARKFFAANQNHNIGAVLGPSGLVSLDVDNVEATEIILSEFGIDIFALRDKYPTVQGNPARFRVMFRAPEGFDLARHSITWPHRDGGRDFTVFELRGGPVQDVLPPSIHPETKQPYKWLTPPGDFWPVIPDELLNIWRNWDVFKKNAKQICPWGTKEAPRAPQKATATRNHSDSVIDRYNQQHAIEEALERYGYKRVGKRYLSPHSGTKLPGVTILPENKCYIHHASDPLCSDESGQPVGPFDLFAHYEYKGDYKAAASSIAKPVRVAQVKALSPEPLNDNEAEAITGEVTEDFLAIVYERTYQNHLRYCNEAGYWYGWTGSKWRQDRTKYAFDLARKICREHAGWMAKFQTARAAGAVEKFAQASRKLAVLQSTFDRHPWLLGTPGGVVDLTTGELRDAVHTDYITRNTAIAPAPPGAVPKRWLQFLDEATRGDAELIRFLRQLAGYALTGDASEEALFFIYGPGGNGKSVFINTLTGILGDYSQAAAMDTFTEQRNEKHTTDLAALKGARLVTASETEQGKAWAESRIKQMTGRDPITARFMHRDNFTYIPEFKIIIVGNHKPRLKSVDESVRRRFNIIPFNVAPKVVDRTLGETLRREWPEILRWAIDGCLDWQQSGMIRPEVVRRETDDYFAEQDVIGQWLEECCDLDHKNRTPISFLFADWEKYAEIANEYVGSSKAFSELLQKRGFNRYRTKSERGFEGIALNPTRPTNLSPY